VPKKTELDRIVLRRLIASTGYSDYVQLGEAIGASSKSIYKWMAGTSKPSAQHLYRLLALSKREEQPK
jgi:transcriptional regulator with XRE-family HTH domain